MATLSNKRYACAGLLCLLTLALVITPAFGAANAAKERKISMLYALSASSGTLTPKHGKGARYKLTLRHLDRSVVWFSDRPARRSGAFAVRALAEAWKGLGFAADPPNAALVYSDTSGRTGRTLIVELSHPRLAKGKLSFVARVLDPGSVTAPDLAAHAAGAEREPASTLVDPTLFIDDTKALAVNHTCVFQPMTVCVNGSFRVPLGFEYDLYRANFSGSSFYKAIFHRSDFEAANLRGVQLTESRLEEDNFERADLTGANLTRTWMEGSDLMNANLTDADLSIAVIFDSYLSFSTLENVDFENSELVGSQFNSTQMRGANLVAATLRGAWFRSANLADSKITDAHLVSVDFTNSDLMGVDFSGSELKEVNFREAKLGGAIFTGARLCNVTMPEGAVDNSGC